VLQTVSIISPVRWGIDSFLDIFVRDAGFSTIGVNLLKLDFFFILALLIALLTFVRRK